MIYDIPLKELRLFTDYGRTSRPLFIVDNQRLLIKKSDIMRLQVGRCATSDVFVRSCWPCLFNCVGMVVNGWFK